MTIWRSLKKENQAVVSLFIDQGVLRHYRANGALTQIVIDDLKLAELRVIKGITYWYLEDNQQAFALIPETLDEIGLIRRYLSLWRGFDYDGLLKFESEHDQSLQLWPLRVEKVA